MPWLDNIIHRHIDLLRIAEQDHFNQLKNALGINCDAHKEVSASLEEVHARLERIASSGPDEYAIGVLRRELEKIVHEFGRQIHALGIKSESIATAPWKTMPSSRAPRTKRADHAANGPFIQTVT